MANNTEIMEHKTDFILGDTRLINYIHLSDAESALVRKWRNHENVRKWMYKNHLISEKEHTDYLERLRNDNNNLCWLVKRQNIYIGIISINRIDHENKNAYLGIYTNPEEKIPGAGIELIDCLKHVSFKILNLHTLKLEVIHSNERAVSFYTKAGFEYEGKLREFVQKDGQWLDVIIMGIINTIKA